MKFLSKLFGKTTPHTRPSQKGSDNSDITRQAAKQAQIINQATFEHADYGDELIAALQHSASQQKSAIKRCVELLESKTLTVEQLHKDITDDACLLFILAHMDDSTHVQTLAPTLYNETQRFELILETKSALLTQALLPTITDEDKLFALEKAVKTRDKKSYKQLRSQRLQKQQEQEALALQHQQSIELKEAIEAHSQRSYNVDYRFKTESFARRIDALKNHADATWLDSTWLNSINQALARCEKVIAQHEVSENIPSTTEKNTPADSENSDALLTLCQSFLNLCLHPETSLEEQTKKYHDAKISYHAHTSARTTGQTKTEETLAHKVCELAERLLDTDTGCRQQLHNYLDTHTRTEVLASSKTTLQPFLNLLNKIHSYHSNDDSTRLAHIITTQHAKIEAYKKEHEALLKNIHSDARRGVSACDQGQLKRVHGIRFSLEKKLKALHDPSELPSHIERAVENFFEQADKLSDWQSFAAAPKLQSLIDNMRALAEQPLTPELQATRIRSYQQEWKTVAGANANEYQTHWEEFKQLADTAYTVCAQHFETLDKKRQENDHACTTLIQQLTDYIQQYDWEKADWSQVEKVVRSAKKEWQQYSPLPKNTLNERKQAFHNAIDAIQDKLNEEYSRNARKKEALILKITNLEKSDDLYSAIETAKKAQQDWKKIGHCRRRDDDALWKQFRAACDTLFTRRDAEKAEQQSQVQAIIDQANAILADMRTLLDNPDDDFLAQLSKLEAYNVAYHELAELPKEKKYAINKQYQQLSEQITDRRQRINNQKRLTSWQQLFALNERANNLRFNEKENTAKESNEKESDDVTTLLDEAKALSHLPNECVQRFVNTLENKNSVSGETSSLHKLCILTEIIANVDSPETDRTARMQYQMELLQNGQQQQLAKENAQSIANHWLSAKAIEPTEYKALFSRFFENWQRLA